MLGLFAHRTPGAVPAGRRCATVRRELPLDTSAASASIAALGILKVVPGIPGGHGRGRGRRPGVLPTRIRPSQTRAMGIGRTRSGGWKEVPWIMRGGRTRVHHHELWIRVRVQVHVLQVRGKTYSFSTVFFSGGRRKRSGETGPRRQAGVRWWRHPTCAVEMGRRNTRNRKGHSRPCVHGSRHGSESPALVLTAAAALAHADLLLSLGCCCSCSPAYSPSIHSPPLVRLLLCSFWCCT